MPARFLLLVPLLLASCTQVERTMPRCWTNRDFAPGQPVTGRVTIVIGDTEDDDPEPGGLISVSPLTCENGSFFLLDPPARLRALAQPYRDGRPMFGSAFEADIDAVVHVLPEQTHSGQVTGYFLKLRAVRDLRRIDRPQWWRWG
jgi:hypothetical protein